MQSNSTETNKLAAISFPLIIVLLVSCLYPAAQFGILSQITLENPAVNYFVTLFSALVLAGLSFWAINQDGLSAQELGLTPGKILPAFGLLGAIWFVFTLIYILLAGGVGIRQFANPAKIVQQWLFVGMAEELLFRGYLLNRLRYSFHRLSENLATTAAVLVSSAVFATLHIPVRLYNHVQPAEMLISMLALFLMGILFSYAYLRTRNLVFAGLLHGSWNVPVFGTQGDLIFILIYVLVIETTRFIQVRTLKEKRGPESGDKIQEATRI